jgi:FAD/FMN-containing dehydrogenase
MNDDDRQAGHVVSAGRQPQLLRRREFLYASGALGATLVAGRPAGSASHQAATASRARPVWLAGMRATPTQADWDALRNQLSTHRLYQPGRSGYAHAHELFSPQYDALQPSGVAYCKTAADVALCLSFVTKFGLAVRMRSGGHSYGGWSSVTGGLILDVSEMNSMTFGTGTVKVGAGIDLINFYSGLATHGKAVPGGSCPTVGIAGLTLGGGIGVLARMYGLTCDNLRSLDVVTAAGETLTCSPTRNEPLYWASRGGGGGNFGVATSFTFGTHDLTTLVLFFLSWPWPQAARVISGWQSWIPHEPDTMWSNLHLSSNFGGLPSVSVGGTFVGSVAGAQAELDKLYHLVGTAPTSATHVAHTFLSAMLLEAGCATVPVGACDTPPGGHLPRVPFYAKSDFFSMPLSKSGINALLVGIEKLRTIKGATGGNGSIAFDALGGAVHKVAPDATAFVHRDALFGAQYYTSWTWPGTPAGRASQLAWIRSYYKAIHPNANGQAYQNYPDPDLVNWRQAYYGANYPQLQTVKATYDPKGLFKFPQAITA